MSANSGDQSILNWPKPCQCSECVPTLKLSGLPNEVKSLVWADLKTNNPRKAECLKIMAEDEVVKQLIKEFDATLTLCKEDLSFGVYEKLKAYFD